MLRTVLNSKIGRGMPKRTLKSKKNKSISNGEIAKIGRLIQGDIPLCDRPFTEVAAAAGLEETNVLQTILKLIASGVVRKFGAVLRHQKAGYTGNAMLLIAADPSETGRIGAKLAGFREVTHCYERAPAFEGKYNIFAMVHAKGSQKSSLKNMSKKLPKSSIDRLIERITGEMGISDYIVLPSIEEFKKTSMVFFEAEK